MSSVTIQMPPDTVQQLAGQGYSLFAFKAVHTNDVSLLPALWYQTQSFGAETVIGWTDGFSAFTSFSQIVPDSQIAVSASYPARIGSTVMITAPDGTGAVSPQGSPGAISIYNETRTEMTCGIGQSVNGQQNIVCAAPLYGEFIVEIAPSEGLLVDFTAPETVSRTVNYDIDTGWEWGGENWGRQIMARSDLVPVLIQNG